jgi:DNA-3-methyladenine glycosylase
MGVPGPLRPKFYARDTVSVARDLLGCVLETKTRGVLTSGRIVEVEAYLGPDDPAAHSFGHRHTERTAPMYGPPGTSYVYFIYGAHWCFNVVTEQQGYPAAVLVRALEPLEGLSAMRRRRRTKDDRLLCSGPGRLCAALGITGSLNRRCLDEERLRITGRNESAPRDIGAGPRIGVSRAASWPLRFYQMGSPWLSRRR